MPDLQKLLWVNVGLCAFLVWYSVLIRGATFSWTVNQVTHSNYMHDIAYL